MFLYVGCRKVWVTNIIRCIDSVTSHIYGYILDCREGPCCTVPFDINVDEKDTIQQCNEYGFRRGETYTGKAAFLLMENLKTELMIDKTLG